MRKRSFTFLQHVYFSKITYYHITRFHYWTCQGRVAINWQDLQFTIQVLWCNSLVDARQNLPITSIFTEFTLGSWKDFDVGLSLIGSKEMIWKTSFGGICNTPPSSHILRWTKCSCIISTLLKLNMKMIITFKQVHCNLQYFTKVMICLHVEEHSTLFASIVHILHTPC